MARGGYRPSAGRPKGARTGSKKLAGVPKDIIRDARAARRAPLDYMLDVMNDESADDARRDRMAIAAAPFVHARPGDAKPGKKEQAAAAAETAGVGTDWGEDLHLAAAPLN